ncbi:hypothetical protein RHVP.R12 [Cricetid gammaherpesvirus 2]|uniref:RING-CH-type domain-containing protein n=1 Tax=Cricetid gammaherpesvirus 2 TaxID=1605972 RepID=E9M5J9_9GAMA|nr:hypothetical protein RHVP.R12 [Cricetid gammaherpesvirus 2]ADW24357.1 hypothetical protein RHVP.R12 [Cricetid gammaherpesvirus 2]ADW24439.1 hypothetical protein RHVP-L.R12 [Cricetid gammaherpesvirus 2]
MALQEAVLPVRQTGGDANLKKRFCSVSLKLPAGWTEEEPEESLAQRCWICLSSCEDGGYCGCKGDYGIVHGSCLKQWVERGKVVSCAFCGEEYAAKRRWYPVKDWILTPSEKLLVIFAIVMTVATLACVGLVVWNFREVFTYTGNGKDFTFRLLYYVLSLEALVCPAVMAWMCLECQDMFEDMAKRNKYVVMQLPDASTTLKTPHSSPMNSGTQSSTMKSQCMTMDSGIQSSTMKSQCMKQRVCVSCGRAGCSRTVCL